METTAQRISLTELVYGILGLAFLRHRNEGLMKVARSAVYTFLKHLADRHPERFEEVFFVERGGFWHSKQVEDVLFRLNGGVLETSGLRHQYLSFSETELREVERNLENWLDTDARAVLEGFSEEFYQFVRSEVV